VGLPKDGPLVFSLEPSLRSTPISVLPDGSYAGANYDFGYPKISSNGRFVVFESDSPQLDPRCATRADGTKPCGASQIFIHDLRTRTTQLASVTSSGGVPNNISLAPWVSGDGRYVTFTTGADNVGPGPDRGDSYVGGGPFGSPEDDVFRRDMLLGKTERVTITADGGELNGADGSISEDGRFVTFVGDWEHRITAERQGAGVQDVYIKDMVTGNVTLASVGNKGERGNHDSITPQISPDGYYVAFWSRATTLSEGPLPTDDLQNRADIFQGRVYVYDLHRHRLSFECVPQSGRVSNDHCIGPSISRDGRYSLFWSDARDLLPNTPHGGTFTHPIINLYLRDRRTGHLELINVTDRGTPIGETGERQFFGVRADRLFRPWVSADGSVVAFDAVARLAPGDRNDIVDAYVRDRTRGRTIRVSETPMGTGGDDQSVYPYPTGDGSVVVFLSLARNLSRPETDVDWDEFVCRWRPS
jgi:Tol biopolymer transport system component